MSAESTEKLREEIEDVTEVIQNINSYISDVRSGETNVIIHRVFVLLALFFLVYSSYNIFKVLGSISQQIIILQEQMRDINEDMYNPFTKKTLITI